MILRYKVCYLIINNYLDYIMKNIYIILVLATFGFLFCSCKTTRKITVSGIPGSNIYKPNMEKVATIQENGTVDISLDKKEFIAFMLSNVPGSSDFVPFALDYKYKNYGTSAAKFTGAYLSVMGGSCMLAGALAADDESLAGPITVGSGAGLLLLGIPFWLSESITGIQGKYLFKYLPEQSTNNDIKFTSYNDKGIKKEVGVSQEQISFEHEESVSTNTNNALSAALSRFKNSLPDSKESEALVVGTYIGTGKIIMDGKQVGLLENLKIKIERIDENFVLVDVQDSNGNSCFGSKNIYKVKRSDDNSYIMSLVDNSDAIIRIDKAGCLEYVHPKAKVDDNIFTLEIKASK